MVRGEGSREESCTFLPPYFLTSQSNLFIEKPRNNNEEQHSIITPHIHSSHSFHIHRRIGNFRKEVCDPDHNLERSPPRVCNEEAERLRDESGKSSKESKDHRDRNEWRNQNVCKRSNE